MFPKQTIHMIFQALLSREKKRMSSALFSKVLFMRPKNVHSDIKTQLFKYILENFTSKNWKFSDEKL